MFVRLRLKEEIKDPSTLLDDYHDFFCSIADYWEQLGVYGTNLLTSRTHKKVNFIKDKFVMVSLMLEDERIGDHMYKFV